MSNDKCRKVTKGFTLVELLVAVGIIIVLATIGAVTYMPAVKHSRDGQRKTDLEKVRSALAIYYSNNDSYPAILNTGAGRLTDSRGNIYLETIPGDPQSGGAYEYKTNSSNTCFWLKATLEREQCYVVTGGDEAECPRQCEVASKCWGVRGFRCDPACNASSVNSNSVYQTCNSATCQVSGCWAIGGGCDGGCGVSSVWSATVYTSCNAQSCGCTKWVRPDGSSPQNRTGGESSMRPLRDVSGNQVGWGFKCWASWDRAHSRCNPPNDCYEGINPYTCMQSRNTPLYNQWCHWSWNPPCYTYAHNYQSRLQLQWVSGPYCTGYYVSGGTTKYTGGGRCSGSGSGNCYKLSGSGVYYTGGSGCGGGGGCSSTWIHHSGYQQCTWKPSYANTYSVSGLTTAYSGSGACSGDGSGNCYKLTGGSTYHTGGSGCGGSGCSGGTYYSASQRCQWYR